MGRAERLRHRIARRRGSSEGNHEADVVKGVGVGGQGARRVSEVPGESVHVTRDVTAGTGRIAVPRGVDAVVKEPPPVPGRGRARIVKRNLHDLCQRRHVHQSDGIGKAQENVETAPGFTEGHPGGPLSDHHGPGSRAVRTEDAAPRETVSIHLEQLPRPDGGQVARASVCLPDHHPGLGDAGLPFREVGGRVAGPDARLAGRAVDIAEAGRAQAAAATLGDVGVEIDPRHRVRSGGIDHREQVVHHVPLDAEGVLEPDEIAGIGVGHIDPAVGRVHRHLEEGRPQVVHRLGRPSGGVGGVDDEEIMVR